MQTFDEGSGAPAPGRLDVTAPAVRLRADLGSGRRPILLCLNGFPDSAYAWPRVAPALADAGRRVVAPFLRCYAPSSIPADGSYHVGTLMDDALRVLQAVGRTGRDVVVGHDWGAMAAAGLAALPDGPFTKPVLVSVPPARAFWPQRGAGLRRSLPVQLPAQAIRFWYIGFFQLTWLPERSRSWLIPLLWRQPHFSAAPLLPTWYLHGAEDGCIGVDLAHRVPAVLPAGSAMQIVERAEHFLAVEQPEEVARHILGLIGAAR